MKQIILVLAIFALMFIPVAQAKYCNNSYEYDSITVGNSTINITKYCDLNCSMNGVECLEILPIEYYAGILMGFPIFIFALLYVAFKWDADKWYMQWFFLFLAMLNIVFFFAFLMGLNLYTQDDMHNIMAANFTSNIYVFMMVVGLFAITYFYQRFTEAGKVVG